MDTIHFYKFILKIKKSFSFLCYFVKKKKNIKKNMGSIKSKASSYFITKSQLQKAAGGVVEGGSLLQGHGRLVDHVGFISHSCTMNNPIFSFA